MIDKIYHSNIFVDHFYKVNIEKGGTLAKWLLEFLGIPRNFFLRIPRNKGVNFHSKFGLGIPRNSQP